MAQPRYFSQAGFRGGPLRRGAPLAPYGCFSQSGLSLVGLFCNGLGAERNGTERNDKRNGWLIFSQPLDRSSTVTTVHRPFVPFKRSTNGLERSTNGQERSPNGQERSGLNTNERFNGTERF